MEHVVSSTVAREFSSAEAMARTPTVSVLTITYQHEAFIAECIDSVLAQRAPCAVERVIGEDDSPDRTRAICLEYQKRRPDMIRLLLPERNTGSYENFRRTFAACRGKYIAVLEGDDFWTSPDKLARQVALLEQHPEWSLCFHNVTIRNEGSQEPERPFFDRAPKAVFSQEDFVERNVVPTCSCMVRRLSGLSLPEWYYDPRKNPYPDWIFNVLHSKCGAAGYIDDVMATHRRHPGGMWGSTFNGTVEGDIRRMLKRLTAFKRLEECVDAPYRRRVREQRARTCFHLALAYREKAEWNSVRKFLIRAILAAPRADIPFGRSLLIACFPPLRERAAARP
jgi:glycosyltransferase involved in cell wall biosynthesis